ncbi:MAG: hypothetical protein HN833_02120 [Elusimicrobiaceae bacterium]|nr:hypothetical protein [Elusimicrobiaceae bacterium]MBT4008683.1 hypothetical protein [Elusimicrobiaceae bacterium]MBT4402481.1 hypothetical protein [Elusimicrobiaceae bacterium]MBT5987217.1 hypothetical protein [Elusimicrobiaceae bacterium]MBT7283187.1 hypothetical protein [Elusimicrobiaceae bacterium]
MLCLISAVLELDTSFIGQFQIARPVVVGTIFGLLTGNIIHGLQVGIFLELLLVDFVPVGAFVVPSGNVAATCILIMHSIYECPPHFIFPIGLLCGWGYAYVEKYIRIFYSEKHELTEKNIVNNLDTIKKWLLRNMFVNLISTFLYVVFVVFVIGKLAMLILPFVTEKINLALIFSYLIIPWIGAGRLAVNFGNNLFNGKAHG